MAVRDQPLGIHAFGTGRQRYVGIGQKNAMALDSRLKSPGE